MQSLQLVSKSDPILRQVCEPVDFEKPPFDLSEFAVELVKFMIDNRGIGLAANQVGVPYRIFAMKAAPQNFVCINPRVVMPSEETILLEEGCLSYPNLFVKIRRPRHVRVRFQMPNGEVRTEMFTGMTARCFQHELDHLDGKVFLEQAGEYHQRQAMDNARKLAKQIERRSKK